MDQSTRDKIAEIPVRAPNGAAHDEMEMAWCLVTFNPQTKTINFHYHGINDLKEFAGVLEGIANGLKQSG